MPNHNNPMQKHLGPNGNGNGRRRRMKPVNLTLFDIVANHPGSFLLRRKEKVFYKGSWLQKKRLYTDLVNFIFKDRKEAEIMSDFNLHIIVRAKALGQHVLSRYESLPPEQRVEHARTHLNLILDIIKRETTMVNSSEFASQLRAHAQNGGINRYTLDRYAEFIESISKKMGIKTDELHAMAYDFLEHGIRPPAEVENALKMVVNEHTVEEKYVEEVVHRLNGDLTVLKGAIDFLQQKILKMPA